MLTREYRDRSLSRRRCDSRGATVAVASHQVDLKLWHGRPDLKLWQGLLPPCHSDDGLAGRQCCLSCPRLAYSIRPSLP